MSFFGDLFGASGKLQDAANAQIQGLAQGYSGATDLYQQGRQQLQQLYGQALTPYQDISKQAMPAMGMYGKALGLGGAQGEQEAQNAFENYDPGRQFAMQQALQAVQRQTGAGGYQGSGNVATALQDRATQLANQQYQGWLQNLAGLQQYALPAATGQAAVQTGLGQGLNTSLTNQGNLLYNTRAGQGLAQAGADIGQANIDQSMLQGVMGLGSKLLGYGLSGGLGGIGAGGSTSLFGGAGPLFGGTNPNAWYTK
jgi:hypothetical protein